MKFEPTDQTGIVDTQEVALLPRQFSKDGGTESGCQLFFHRMCDAAHHITGIFAQLRGIESAGVQIVKQATRRNDLDNSNAEAHQVLNFWQMVQNGLF